MIATCALIAMSVTSCKEDPKTGAECLTGAKNGWKLTTAVADPAYPLEVGAPVTNLLQGFVKDCELDDILYFQTTKVLMLNPGKDKKTVVDLGEESGFGCGTATEISLGNWELNGDEKSFSSFYLPYFDEKMTNNTIIELTETTLIVSVTFKDTDSKNYTFTLTYTKQ